MFSKLAPRLVLVVTALFIAGVAYSQMPAQKTEAVITSSTYESFSYSASTGLATWNFRLTINDTFNQHFLFSTVGPAGTTVTAVAVPATCVGLPKSAPVDCDITFPPGGNTLLLTMTTPFPQLCTAQVVAIGPITVTQSSINNPVGVVSNFGNSTDSFVGGVRTPNNVPANAALCPVTPNPPTPIPATATPTPTPVVPQPQVIPQVVQNPARGGIFNGSRNDTPTPVRPAAESPSIPIDPGGIVVTLRPPSTGDAGMLRLRLLKLSAW